MQCTHQERFRSCYEEWLSQQALDLGELSQALAFHSAGGAITDEDLRAMAAKSMRHYEQYVERRGAMAREDAPAFFFPAWCNSFEGSFFWIAGCRPTMIIRLVYSLSSLELEAHLEEVIQGTLAAADGLPWLSARQLVLLDALHASTLKEEDRLSSAMATLQEDVADMPLLTIVKDSHRRRLDAAASNGPDGGVILGFNNEGNGEVKEVMDRYSESLAGILEEADRLRVATLRELALSILSPMQAVELLVAAKQLHLTLHEWGRCRDRQHGRA